VNSFTAPSHHSSSRLLLRWLPAILWAALIFTLSSFTFATDPGHNIPNADKFGHITVYYILGCLVARAWRANPRFSTTQLFILTVLVTSAYGATDEWHQSYVPGRAPEFADWIADTLAALLAATTFHLHDKIRSQKETR
jgi:VanZ family protein